MSIVSVLLSFGLFVLSVMYLVQSLSNAQVVLVLLVLVLPLLLFHHLGHPVLGALGLFCFYLPQLFSEVLVLGLFLKGAESLLVLSDSVLV